MNVHCTGGKLGEDGGCAPLEKEIPFTKYISINRIYKIFFSGNESYLDVEFNRKSFFNVLFSVILDWYFF